MEFRDDVTGGHIDRTTLYLKVLFEKMVERGLYKELIAAWDVGLLIQSAQLHDVGKISIPDNILNKLAKLTDDEFTVMKSHAQLGKEVIKKIIEKVDEMETGERLLSRLIAALFSLLGSL